MAFCLVLFRLVELLFGAVGLDDFLFGSVWSYRLCVKDAPPIRASAWYGGL